MLNVSPFMLFLLKSWLEFARPSVKDQFNERDGWSNNYGFDNVENVPHNSNENKEKKSTI
jgi:hypothetical protein